MFHGHGDVWMLMIRSSLDLKYIVLKFVQKLLRQSPDDDDEDVWLHCDGGLAPSSPLRHLCKYVRTQILRKTYSKYLETQNIIYSATTQKGAFMGLSVHVESEMCCV